MRKAKQYKKNNNNKKNKSRGNFAFLKKTKKNKNMTDHTLTREKQRNAENRYRESHREKLLERSRIYEQTDHRKQLKQEWRENNREKVCEYTKNFLSKKRKEDPTFREREAERLRKYRETEDYFHYIDERKGDVNYQWSVLKWHSKQRGKGLELTLDEFMIY